MQNITIKDAVIKVLEKAKSPMTATEIYQNIMSEGLFVFKSKTAESVLKSTIRNNCLGIETKKSPGNKTFKKIGSKYWLNNDQF